MENFGLFLLALCPILWLVFALIALKMQAHTASIGAFIVSLIVAFFVFHMTPSDAFLASLEGVAMALWPIVLVIIAAVFTYNLTVYSKSMNVIKRMLTGVSDDMRILVLLIGWCFGGFLEGMAGFGTAIAIPASMLAGLGLNPITSILVCLLANGTPTPFGSIGIPNVTLANLVGLDNPTLAFAYALQCSLFMFISPFLMVAVTGKSVKSLKGMIPTTLIAALSYVIPVLLVSKYVGAELPVIVASVCSLTATFAYAYFTSKKHVTPSKFKVNIEEKEEVKITVSSALKAWSPFILIFILLLATSKLVPFISEPLSAIKTTVKFYEEYTFTWINTPGVLIFISAIIGGLIQGLHIKDFRIVLVDTVKQMSRTIITMIFVLCCAKVMGYSGMISAIALFFVSTLSNFYPLVAPLIGCIGTFVTGSGTSSAVLFGNVQLQAAQAIQADPYWIVAANSLGVGAGKMISPQSIAIGCAAVSISGKDGEILSKIFKYALVFLIFMALIVYFGQGFYQMIK